MLKRLRVFLLLFCLLFSCSAWAQEVRVALVEGQNTVALKAEDAFAVRDALSGKESILPKGKYFAHLQDGNISLEEHRFGREIEIFSVEGGSLPGVNGREYDGFLRVRARSTSLLAVNVVELESLLARTVPQKTMVIWPDEAIKAQIIAERTYILHKLLQGKSADYDLQALDKEAPYQGMGKRTEKPRITTLIKETQGQYIADAAGRPVFAVSTSSTGGRTETGIAVFGQAYSYLRSVEDFDSDSPEYKWEFRISPSYVLNILEQNGFAIGKLTNIRLSALEEPGNDRSQSGRVRYLIFGGTSGTATVSGEQLMDMLKLNSTFFELEVGVPTPEAIKVPIENVYGQEVAKKDIPISIKEGNSRSYGKFLKNYHAVTGEKDERITFRGRGKGHGAGLSAWGARALALGDEPKSCAQILAHYFPGTHIVK